MIYYAIVEKDADSCYGVRFPDLPGCFSAVDDENEILANAQAALALYADGEQQLPVPRALDALRDDRQVRKALAAGAFLLAVPLLVTEKKVRANIMIDRALLEGVDRQAKAAGLSRSEYLAQAAVDRLRSEGAVIAQRDKSSRLRTL